MEIRVKRHAGESDLAFAKRRLYRTGVASLVTLVVGIAWLPFFPAILDRGVLLFLFSGALSVALVLAGGSLAVCLVLLLPILGWYQLEAHFPSLTRARRRGRTLGEGIVCLALMATSVFELGYAIVTGKVSRIGRTAGGEFVTGTINPGFFVFYVSMWSLFLLTAVAWAYVLARRSRTFVGHTPRSTPRPGCHR